MIRWISSYPKSGNTWVRLFLMAYADPAGFDINQRSINHTMDTNPVIYDQVSPVNTNDLSDEEVRLLRGAVLVRIARLAYAKTGGPPYLKTHSANVAVNGLAWIPGGHTDRALYLIRDPRGVVSSLADHLGVTVDDAIKVMANKDQKLDKWDTIVHVPLMSWSLHVGSWRRKLPYDVHALRYEDLIADPNQHFQRVLKFFDIPFDRSKLNDAMELTSFDALRAGEERSGFEAKSEKQKRFFRGGKADGWRQVLTDKQESTIVMDHGAVMAECGYLN